MKTKKSLLAGAVFALVIAFCAAMTACGSPFEDCSHSWGDWYTVKSATCTEAGTRERKCEKCGEIRRNRAALDAKEQPDNRSLLIKLTAGEG